MKQVNLNIPLLNLDGSETEVNIGSVIANVIATESKGDALKIFGWAVSLSRKELLLLDDSDLTTFKNLIKDNERLTIIVKAQALKLIDKAEDYKKPK